MSMDWVDDFLHDLCCPLTRQPLRHATDLEKQQAGLVIGTVALANEAGTYVYPLAEGILRLLPDDARPLT